MYMQHNLLAAGIVAAAVWSGGTHTALANDFMLEEVIVTATKRAESLQDIPVSVTAFTGDAIKQLGMTDSGSIATQTPNLSWRSDFGSTSPNIFLRGIGNNSFHANAVGAVGIYSDGVYLNSNLSHGFQLFDLERVEVLRGPQGTLYGRNTTGGLINFIARKPNVDDGYNGSLTTTLGTYNQRDLEIAAGAPLNDYSAIRFAAQSQKRDGLFDSTIAGADDKGENESIAWRLNASSQPTDTLQINLNLHGAKNNSDMRPFKSQGVVCPGGGAPQPGFGNGCTDFLGFEASKEYDEVSESLNTKQQTENYGASLTLDWELDGVTITSVSAWEDADRTMLEDTDRSPAEFFNGSYQASATQYSQELRFTSSGDSELEWMAGLFYFKEDMEQYEAFSLNDLGPGAITAGTGLPGFAAEGLAFISAQETLSYSAFTELGYPVTDNLKLTMGLRWTYDERDLSDYRTTIYDASGSRGQYIKQSAAESLGYEIASYPQNADWSELSGRITLDYTVNNDILLYYSLSRGFKGGEFNAGATLFPEEFVIADPEFLTANEVGIKSTWIEGSLKLNAALFHYDFKDQQVFTLASGGGLGIPVQTLTNAGKSEIQGLEVELQYVPVDGWYIQVGLGWLDTEFKEYELTDPSSGLVTDYSGNDQPAAPEWNLNGLVRYEWSLESGSVVSLQTDFVYTDDQFFTADNNPSLTEEAYWLWNARANFTTADERYSVSIWGKNLFDKEYITTAFDLADFGFNSVGIGDPRTVGVTLAIKFE